MRLSLRRLDRRLPKHSPTAKKNSLLLARRPLDLSPRNLPNRVRAISCADSLKRLIRALALMLLIILALLAAYEWAGSSYVFPVRQSSGRPSSVCAAPASDLHFPVHNFPVILGVESVPIRAHPIARVNHLRARFSTRRDLRPSTSPQPQAQQGHTASPLAATFLRFVPPSDRSGHAVTNHRSTHALGRRVIPPRPRSASAAAAAPSPRLRRGFPCRLAFQRLDPLFQGLDLVVQRLDLVE